jgi:hypothetical protein
MKNLILTFFAVSLTLILSAQTTAYEYMKRAPGIPTTVCKTKAGIQDAFIMAVKDLSSAIHEDAQTRSKKAEEYMKGNEEQMKASMIKKSGISDEDVKKLQSGKEMTQAEQDAMVNKMMQQQYNISLDEAKNMKNMSKEGQEAWAQGYVAEQMAVAQANPGQNKGADKESMSLYELLSEQTSLRNKVTAMENQLRQKYVAIDKEAEAAKAALEVELKPLYEELHSINDGEGSTQADVDHSNRVIKKIQAKQDIFCEKFTPRMLGFIQECKDSFGKSIPDYDRLEEIQFQVTAVQTGTTLMTAGTGMYSIQAVEQYLGYLGEAYRYKLYRTE